MTSSTFWKTKKVLVTGGAGFIGSNLSITLFNLGASVEVLDSFSPFCGSNPFNLSEIEKRIRIHRSDMNQVVLDSVIADKDYIFHLAGQTGHSFGQQKPEVDLDINQRATIKLLDACKRTQSKAKIVYASTRQIHGEPQSLPVDERHPINPIDNNGVHKAASEQYFKIYRDVYGIDSCSLRLTNTYGPRQLIKNQHYGVIGWFINRTLQNEPLTLADGGKQTRDFSYVEDSVNAFIKLAESDKSWGECFTISGERATLRELAEKMVSIAGSGRISDITITGEDKKIQIKDYYGSSEKLERTTGWKDQVSLSDGLSRTFDFYKSHLTQYLGG